jgi:hypothetical protein
MTKGSMMQSLSVAVLVDASVQAIYAQGEGDS